MVALPWKLGELRLSSDELRSSSVNARGVARLGELEEYSGSSGGLRGGLLGDSGNSVAFRGTPGSSEELCGSSEKLREHLGEHLEDLLGEIQGTRGSFGKLR